LPEEEVNNYGPLIDFLIKYKRDAKVKVNGAKVSVCYLPLGYGYEYPRMILYKKRSPEDMLPTHTTVLYTRNMMLQVWLPLNKNDHFNNTRILIMPPVCPPLFFGSHSNLDFPIRTRELDLSSNEVLKGEEEELNWNFSKQDFEDIGSFDPVTGKFEKKEFNPNEIRQIILSHKEFKFDNGEERP